MSWELLVRLVVALILGSAIGIEREYRSKDAGFRTHFLVALGSALFTVVSMYGFPGDSADSSRVAAQVVSGIGFLGAGMIIFQRNFIRGLTTAAGLWVTAAVGMACGTGNYFIAVATTVLVLVGLEVLNALIFPVVTSHVHVEFSSTDKAHAKNVVAQIMERSKSVYDYNFKEVNKAGSVCYEVSIDVKIKGKNPTGQFIEIIENVENISVNRIE